MPQRVLHIIESLAQHGTAKQLRLVAQGLAVAGLDVHVCVLAGAPGDYAWCADLAEFGVDTTILTHRTAADITCLPSLYRRIREIQPDVVQTWLPRGNLFGRLAARAAGVGHIVGSLRDCDPFAKRWRWPVERWLANRTDAMVANSEAARQFAVRRGIDAGRVHVIRNAVEPGAVSCYERKQLLDRFGLPDDARLLGTVGPLLRSKNLKHMAWVLDIFKGIHEPVYLLVLGDGPYRERAMMFAQQIEVDDRIRFLGHRDDVLDVLPHLDVYVSCSQHEGCASGLLEAMAAGVPPVVTDIAAHREVVQHGETGFLMPVGSRADVARHAKKLLDSKQSTGEHLADEHLASQIGRQAQASVLAAHDVSTMVQQYRALYEKIAG